MAISSLVSLGYDQGFLQYLERIKQFPLLSPEEEYSLACRWRDQGDCQAAHRLVTSHLRFVAKISLKYRGYGLPMNEVIAEGNIGLMQAVKRFEPKKGFRLATYALWWIKAAIQEFILRSWSLVKLGTTSDQKKLFFGLRRAKQKIQAVEGRALRPDQIAHIASDLGVSEEDVASMDMRLKGDTSLNIMVGSEENSQWQDLMADQSENQEVQLVRNEEASLRGTLLSAALSLLKGRERDIFEARRLCDPPKTLDELSKGYAISRERVRQIETRAFEKIQAFVTSTTQERALPGRA